MATMETSAALDRGRKAAGGKSCPAAGCTWDTLHEILGRGGLPFHWVKDGDSWEAHIKLPLRDGRVLRIVGYATVAEAAAEMGIDLFDLDEHARGLYNRGMMEVGAEIDDEIAIEVGRTTTGNLSAKDEKKRQRYLWTSYRLSPANARPAGWSEKASDEAIGKWWGSIGPDARTGMRVTYAAIQDYAPKGASDYQKQEWWAKASKDYREDKRRHYRSGGFMDVIAAPIKLAHKITHEGPLGDITKAVKGTIKSVLPFTAPFIDVQDKIMAPLTDKVLVKVGVMDASKARKLDLKGGAKAGAKAGAAVAAKEGGQTGKDAAAVVDIATGGKTQGGGGTDSKGKKVAGIDLVGRAMHVAAKDKAFTNALDTARRIASSPDMLKKLGAAAGSNALAAISAASTAATIRDVAAKALPGSAEKIAAAGLAKFAMQVSDPKKQAQFAKKKPRLSPDGDAKLLDYLRVVNTAQKGTRSVRAAAIESRAKRPAAKKAAIVLPKAPASATARYLVSISRATGEVTANTITS